MLLTLRNGLAAALLGMVGFAGASVAQSPIEGTWLTNLRSEITIAPCDSGYCGYITKIVVPDTIAAAEQAALETLTPEQYVDARNRDPSLRGRPILGLQILSLRPGKSPQVWDGDIYNPEDGNTYSGYIEVLGTDSIRLNGCVLYNLICRGEQWLRVPSAN